MTHPHDLMFRIQEAASLSTLASIAGTHFKDIGFEKFAYVILDLPQDRTLNKSYVTNYPLEWQNHYRAHDYFRLDPIHDIARRRKTSFVWGADEPIIPMTAQQKIFFEESGDIGTSQGMSVPVLLPRGGFCLLSLCSDTLDKKDMQLYLKEIETGLIATALMLHQAALALCEPGQQRVDYDLTEAEKKTLYWLCQNKTYEDIAVILGLSREGVSERLRKVYRKMCAVGKIDAVKKAIESGLVNL